MNLLDKIIEYVKNNPGCMAKDLARTFEVERSYINSFLYKYKNKYFKIDDYYRWYLIVDIDEDVENGIYIDFEGTAVDPPVMLGLMYKKNDGNDYFEQMIFEPLLKTAAEAKSINGGENRYCVYLDSLEDALMRVIKISRVEKRKIYAWSIREENVFFDSKISSEEKGRLEIVNALKVARQWARKNYDITKIPKNDRGGKYTLENFAKIFDFEITRMLRSGNSASRLRSVMGQLKKRHYYENLTPVTKRKWNNFLMHNKYDLILTKKILKEIYNNH